MMETWTMWLMKRGGGARWRSSVWHWHPWQWQWHAGHRLRAWGWCSGPFTFNLMSKFISSALSKCIHVLLYFKMWSKLDLSTYLGQNVALIPVNITTHMTCLRFSTWIVAFLEGSYLNVFHHLEVFHVYHWEEEGLNYNTVSKSILQCDCVLCENQFKMLNFGCSQGTLGLKAEVWCPGKKKIPDHSAGMWWTANYLVWVLSTHCSNYRGGMAPSTIPPLRPLPQGKGGERKQATWSFPTLASSPTINKMVHRRNWCWHRGW